MISRFNMGKLSGSADRNSGDETRAHRRPAEQGGNGTVLDLSRLQPEGRSSTPLRNRNAAKATPLSDRDQSPVRVAMRGLGEESTPSAELRRRAEAVSDVLQGNIFHVQDVVALQIKAIELAERLRRLEEWYSSQLQERSTYIEHRISRLATAAVSGTSQPLSDGAGDKWLSPTTIRSRCNASATTSAATSGRISHPVTTTRLNVDPLWTTTTTTATENGPLSPNRSRSRQSPQSTFTPGASNRSPVMDMDPLMGSSHYASLRHSPARPSMSTGKRQKDISGSGGRTRLSVTLKESGERRDKKKMRSSSATIGRGTRGAIGDIGDVTGDDDSHQREHHSMAGRRKRRSTGGSSSGFQGLSLRTSTTTKRPLSSSVQLVSALELAKRE